MMLSDEQKQNWRNLVDALRSGKYGQVAGNLKVHVDGEASPRYCCLGIASEITGIIPTAIPKSPTANTITYCFMYYDGDYEHLGRPEDGWWISNFGAFPTGHPLTHYRLAEKNDMGATFAEIAQTIVDNLRSINAWDEPVASTPHSPSEDTPMLS